MSFFIDGKLASLPTTTFFRERHAGRHDLRQHGNWAQRCVSGRAGHAYAQLGLFAEQHDPGSSAAFIAGLQVLSPIPATNSAQLPHHSPATATYSAIPVSNVDLAITSITANPGTYLLDDAAGTGVLPWSASRWRIYRLNFTANPRTGRRPNLELHLSTDHDLRQFRRH